MKMDFWTGDFLLSQLTHPQDFFLSLGLNDVERILREDNLLETVNGATVGTRNELGHTLWQRSSAQH
jgi:hypothetical protein